MQAVLYEEQGNLYDRMRDISMSTINSRTTVSINKATKFRIDQWRAYGQCYDGFLCELVDLWEKMHRNSGRYETRAIDKRMST